MEEIVIQIKDKQKAQWLTNLLQALDFVTSVRVTHKKQVKRTAQDKTDADFFSYAGIWANQDITVTTLRNKAWPRQQL